MSTFKLSKPLALMNGKEISELNLEWDALTLSDLKTANTIAKMVADPTVGGVDNGTFSPRLDPNLRVAIAWTAAIKGTPGLMRDDVLKLPMIDALCLGEEALANYLFR